LEKQEGKAEAEKSRILPSERGGFRRGQESKTGAVKEGQRPKKSDVGKWEVMQDVVKAIEGVLQKAMELF